MAWPDDFTMSHVPLVFFIFFPKQFTVGVLNATLDLAALVLVGVAVFFGWVLVGVAGYMQVFDQITRFKSEFA